MSNEGLTQNKKHFTPLVTDKEKRRSIIYSTSSSSFSFLLHFLLFIRQFFLVFPLPIFFLLFPLYPNQSLSLQSIVFSFHFRSNYFLNFYIIFSLFVLTNPRLLFPLPVSFSFFFVPSSLLPQRPFFSQSIMVYYKYCSWLERNYDYRIYWIINFLIANRGRHR